MTSFKKHIDKLKHKLCRDVTPVASQMEITALITGASSGMGLLYAEYLAEAGCNLLIVSNQEKELKEVAANLKERFGVNVIACYQDLSREDSAQQLFDYCKNNNLIIDILINNAGMFFFHELDDEYHRKMELMLNLHVMTPSKMSRLFGEEMKKRGFGHIILVSSMAARLPFPGITTYSATKAYLKSFGKSLYYEMRDHGVGVTTVCPGAIATPLYQLNPKLLKLGVKIGLIGTPQWLVRKTLRGMFRKKMIVAPGAMNVYLPPLLAILPKPLINYIWRKVK
ncbi:MAG: SDR family NAD(P)-dependent oxidoreductase [Bacteroidales bacterium]|nr:SDR family NAD(P)-dependent oxidoreductase [Bacteroidales bacterium]